MDAAKAFGIAFQVPADLVSKYKNQYNINLEAPIRMTTASRGSCRRYQGRRPL
jgi:hypothetical protein